MEKYSKMAVFRRYLAGFRRILDAFLAGFCSRFGADWGPWFPRSPGLLAYEMVLSGSERGLGSPHYSRSGGRRSIYYLDGQRPEAPGEMRRRCSQPARSFCARKAIHRSMDKLSFFWPRIRVVAGIGCRVTERWLVQWTTS